MKYKYLILDFGNVIVTPTTGDWNITPKFLELVDINKVSNLRLKRTVKKYSYLLSEQMTTLEEEYDMFIRFYDSILSSIDYPSYDIKIAKEIAYNRTYEHDKYTLCDNIVNELEYLSKKYKLIMLTDNWPCVIPYLKDNNIYDYFDKIYISSVYHAVKKDGILFDYVINDYNIKPHEALFIDDYELNLDVALSKGFDVLLMDRYNSNAKSKHKVINDLMHL